MTFWILAAGLFFLPLTGVIVIEPVISIIHNTKEMLAIITCLLFIAYAQNSGHVRKSNINKLLSALIVFIIFSINASPKISLIYNSVNIGNLWEWKAFAVILIYYMFYLAYARISLTVQQNASLCKIIGLTAIISSVYAIFQALGLDQAQSVKTLQQIGSPDAPGITAMIGNPTYLAIYLVASLPFVWHFFKKYATLPVVVAIILCKSDTGYAGLVLMFLILTISKCRKNIRIYVIIAISILILCFFGKNYKTFSDNGRFQMWKQAAHEFYNPPITMQITPSMSAAQKAEIQKLNSKKYVMTGLGLGSFPIIHNANKKFVNPSTAWMSLHNVYFDVLWSLGIIGLLLFLSTIYESFYHFYKKEKNKTDYLILFSFVFLLLASCLHSTILHEPTRFLMVFLFCMISFDWK